MISKVRQLISDDGMKARAARGSVLTFLSFGGAQALRFVSSLTLTRLLMPEVFGLMALIQVFLTALELFSDTGLSSVVTKSKRGTEPRFLNTVWSIQILRGVLLALIAWAIAGPVAAFYDEPNLAVMLPIAGLNAVILGFLSTRRLSADRNMMQGRLTIFELLSQALGICFAIGLVWVWPSIWSLIISGLIGSVIRVIFSHTILLGEKNWPVMEKTSLSEIFGYGKYIFLASIGTFLVMNSDRTILGKFISLELLGIYNIGLMLGSLPLLLAGKLVVKIFFPLYTHRPPIENEAYRKKLNLLRYGLSGGLSVICLTFALLGNWLIDLLYTDTFSLAGPILVLISIAALPSVFLITYPYTLLANGNSRDYMILLLTQGVLQVLIMYFLVAQFGIIGAIFAPSLAIIANYPVMIWKIARYKSWDPIHDGIMLAFAGIAIALVLFWNDGTAIQPLLSYGS